MNKKTRAARPCRVPEQLEPLPVAARTSRTRMKQLESHSRELESEITRLECAIASSPVIIGERRLASRDTLPPLRPTATLQAHRPSKLPQAQRRAQQRARIGKLVELLIVFGLLAAALSWMNQHFRW